MNVLIDSNFNAVRRGQFVSANSEANEFILTDETELPLATLKEVARANKVKIGSRDNKHVVVAKLMTHFGDIKMPEQNEQTLSEKVAGIVKVGLDAGKSEDEILVQIVIEAGAKFGAAKRLYRQAAEAAGLMMSVKDRQELVDAVLNTMEFSPESFADVQDAMNAVTEEVKSTNDKQALACIKKWAKVNEIEMPKKPKPEAGERKTFRDTIFDYLIANPGAKDQEIKDWVESEKAGKKNLESLQRSAVSFMKYLRQFHESVEAMAAE